jgi:hypothetical protein
MHIQKRKLSLCFFIKIAIFFFLLNSVINFYFFILLKQVANRRNVEDLNDSASIVIYSPVSRLSVSHQQPSASALSVASTTLTFSGNPISTLLSQNITQEDNSPLLSFCSVTNTLLNQ